MSEFSEGGASGLLRDLKLQRVDSRFALAWQGLRDQSAIPYPVADSLQKAYAAS